MNDKPTLSQLFNDVAIESRSTLIFFNGIEPGPHKPKSENYYIYHYLHYLAEAIAMLVNKDLLLSNQNKILRKYKAGLESIITKHNNFLDLSDYNTTKI